MDKPLDKGGMGEQPAVLKEHAEQPKGGSVPLLSQVSAQVPAAFTALSVKPN